MKANPSTRPTLALEFTDPAPPPRCTPKHTRPAWKVGRITLLAGCYDNQWVSIIAVYPGRKYLGQIIDFLPQDSEELEEFNGLVDWERNRRITFSHSDILQFKPRDLRRLAATAKGKGQAQ